MFLLFLEFGGFTIFFPQGGFKPPPKFLLYNWAGGEEGGFFPPLMFWPLLCFQGGKS